MTMPPTAFGATASVVSALEFVGTENGAAPAPPPTIRFPEARASDDAQVEALEKYGMPPDVPLTVKASVPFVVTGVPPIEINPPVKLAPTDVTVPVLPDSPTVCVGQEPVTAIPEPATIPGLGVPLPPCVIGSVPPESSAKPLPVPGAMPSGVMTPALVEIVDGAPPEPPPTTSALFASAPLDAHVEPLEK